MIISIGSGKGGTGKTTLAVNLALVLENVQLLDCDVEEPNAHLFLKPEIREKKPATVLVPVVDESKCDSCGKCREVCAYHAIAVFPKDSSASGNVLVFRHLCHSCGGCSLLCPHGAITEQEREIGIVESGACGSIEFVHGILTVGEIMSPPLIKQVKKHLNRDKTVIIDAPPGTSCPFIASVQGSDFCILVTEPTPFGLYDLTLTVEVVEKLQLPFGVIINRSDIGNGDVEHYCRAKNIPILMRIPFDRKIASLYSEGIPFINVQKEYMKKFRDMAQTIEDQFLRRQYGNNEAPYNR